jgi:hypothetical protein
MRVSSTRLAFFVALFFVILKTCAADPAAVFYDPGMMHSVFGINRYPTELEDWTIDLSISPFYQHASGARDKDGNKVPTGDRLGRWEMFPIWWGDSNLAAPTSSVFNATNYPTVHNLWRFSESVLGITEATFSDDTNNGTLTYDGAYSVEVDYEKVGIRLEFDSALASGFGLTIKMGVVDYKQTPTFTNMKKSPSGNLETFVDDHLMTPTTLAGIASDLSLGIDRYQTTAFEDTFAQLYWSNRFRYNDQEGNHIVSVAPYIGAGVWIPTGKKKNQNEAFSLPTGHDGFWGVMLEGAINLDFPGMVLVNFGVGATFFETKTLSDQRVPTHKDQAGIYPWKAKIKRRFGTSWNLSFSLIARKIIDNLSAYFDYLYCRHERDSITMQEATSTRNGYFLPKKMEEESSWRSQMIQLGFDYKITPNLSLGAAGQTHISGFRVYKTHTVLGSITFTF